MIAVRRRNRSRSRPAPRPTYRRLELIMPDHQVRYRVDLGSVRVLDLPPVGGIPVNDLRPAATTHWTESERLRWARWDEVCNIADLIDDGFRPGDTLAAPPQPQPAVAPDPASFWRTT